MRSILTRTAIPAAVAALLAAPAIAADTSQAQSQGGQGQAQQQEMMQNQGQGQGQGQGTGMQQQGSQAHFSDQKLKSFASAVQGIQEVAREYAPRLREAENPQQAAELEQEAEGKMMEQVQEEGLTVEEYNQIAVAAQTNPQLAQTIQTYIEGQAD